MKRAGVSCEEEISLRFWLQPFFFVVLIMVKGCYNAYKEEWLTVEGFSYG